MFLLVSVSSLCPAAAPKVRKSANTLTNVLTRRQGCDCDSLTVMVGPEQRVSHALWRGARGLVFVTVVKVKFFFLFFWRTTDGNRVLCFFLHDDDTLRLLAPSSFGGDEKIAGPQDVRKPSTHAVFRCREARCTASSGHRQIVYEVYHLP